MRRDYKEKLKYKEDIMELNVKEQIEKLQAEIAQLAGQARNINDQVVLLQNQGQQLVNALLKKQGALELLQALNGSKENKE